MPVFDEYINSKPKRQLQLQGGPLLVINRVMAPISRVITPNYPFTRPFIEAKTPFITTTWRIIPFSKWLIAMVSKSPNWGCSPYKWPKWLINGGY